MPIQPRPSLANLAPVVHGAKGTTMEELLNFIAYEDDFTGGVYIG